MTPARPTPSLLLVLALSLAGCSRSSASEPTPPGDPPPPPPVLATSDSPPATAAPVAPAPVDPGASKPSDTLFGLLGAEAQNRPRITPNADDVYGALDKAGYGVGDRRQSLGRTYEASYCSGGYTNDASLAVNVCEYPDEAAAKSGLARARTLFPGMTSRMLVGHKATLLTIINQKGDAAADARAKRIAAVYAAI